MTISSGIALPDPPEEYDAAYMRKLVSQLEQLLRELNSRQRILATTANFSSLPTSTSGLRVGDLWNDAGDVKVVT